MGLKEYIKRNRESAWLLGIVPNGYDDLKNGNIFWVSKGKYKKKWFADPFILDVDDNFIYLLVEEYDYAINRGRIAKISIDRKTLTIIDCVILLDLPTHLSFPVIYRRNGKIYVAPENNCSGEFYIYEYDLLQEKMVKLKELCHRRLTDAIIFENENGFHLLTTYEPKPNGCLLSIFHSDDFLGNYTLSQEILFESNIARNAGQLFCYNGQLVRPAQESNYSYGHGLVFQKVDIENGKFNFIDMDYCLSPHPVYKAGIHTYNEYKGLGVIDVKGDRNRLIGGLFGLAHRILVGLGLRHNKLLS